MAKPQQSENNFIKRATRMGLEAMLKDVGLLLSMDLTEAQRVPNEEMKAQIENFLEELK